MIDEKLITIVQLKINVWKSMFQMKSYSWMNYAIVALKCVGALTHWAFFSTCHWLFPTPSAKWHSHTTHLAEALHQWTFKIEDSHQRAHENLSHEPENANLTKLPQRLNWNAARELQDGNYMKLQGFVPPCESLLYSWRLRNNDARQRFNWQKL